MKGALVRSARSASRSRSSERAWSSATSLAGETRWAGAGDDGGVRGRPSWCRVCGVPNRQAAPEEEKWSRLPTEAGAPSVESEHSSTPFGAGCYAWIRVLVFDMWVARIGQTYLWPDGFFAARWRPMRSSSMVVEAALTSCRDASRANGCAVFVWFVTNEPRASAREACLHGTRGHDSRDPGLCW